MPKPFDKSKLDVSQVFLTFTALVGDVSKTAAALDLHPDVVQQLANEEGWDEKIRRISYLSKSGKPGDHAKSVNRALCFVQSHRIRALIDRMLVQFEGKSPEEIEEALSTTDRNGNVHMSARFFADLASAAEKCHAMSYLALSDTVREREELQKEDGGVSANALHAAVIAALNNPASKAIEAEILVEAAAKQVVQEIKALPIVADPATTPTGSEQNP